AQHVVEDRVQERLGLARARARGDECRQWSLTGSVATQGGQPLVCLRLVPVGGPPWPPLQVPLPAVVRRPERQTQPEVWPLEDPVVRVFEELLQGSPRLGVSQREGRRQVVDEPVRELPRLERREELAHDCSI